MWLLLHACAGAVPKATAFKGVPLPYWAPADQERAAQQIQAVCGFPPVCPPSAAVERATLDYAKLRREIQAVGK